MDRITILSCLLSRLLVLEARKLLFCSQLPHTCVCTIVHTRSSTNKSVRGKNRNVHHVEYRELHVFTKACAGAVVLPPCNKKTYKQIVML